MIRLDARGEPMGAFKVRDFNYEGGDAIPSWMYTTLALTGQFGGASFTPVATGPGVLEVRPKADGVNFSKAYISTPSIDPTGAKLLRLDATVRVTVSAGNVYCYLRIGEFATDATETKTNGAYFGKPNSSTVGQVQAFAAGANLGLETYQPDFTTNTVFNWSVWIDLTEKNIMVGLGDVPTNEWIAGALMGNMASVRARIQVTSPNGGTAPLLEVFKFRFRAYY